MDLTTATLDSLNFRITLDQLVQQDKDTQQTIRLACQTNLRFLANCVLRPNNLRKFPYLLEKVHGKIIDGFLKSNPFQPLEEWSNLDEFIVLASRGMLKSTIGASFLTQIILCDPNVRILIVSGKLDKAESILEVAREPFISNDIIRLLFPDWAVEEEDIKAKEFVSPKRDKSLNYRDPTISTASFDSVKAGGHYELILFDDATNEINSNNVENCEKTHSQYDATDPLVEPGGYRVFLGTKWLEDDLPAYIQQKSQVEFEKTGQHTASYFFLPAWTLKTEGSPKEVDDRKQREKTGSLIPADVVLTWPEKLSAKMLFTQYRHHRIDFYKQYLLDASVEQQHSFLPEILDRQFVDRAVLRRIPINDRAVVVYWDLASVFTGRRKKSESDYTCGVICLFQKTTGHMFVVDSLLEHFNSSDDMAYAMVMMYRTALTYGPIIGNGIEDSTGARNLESSVYRIAKDVNVPLTGINLIDPEKSLNSKNVQISILASAMKSGFVFLIKDIPFVDDIRSQFERWTIDSKKRKDDAPDSIAKVWVHYRNLVHMDILPTMQTEGRILSWEPELPDDVIDSNTEDMEQADTAWLSTFTSPHAD